LYASVIVQKLSCVSFPESFDNDNDAKEFVQAKIEGLVAHNEAQNGPEGISFYSRQIF
jgi:hypothetical protein